MPFNVTSVLATAKGGWLAISFERIQIGFDVEHAVSGSNGHFDDAVNRPTGKTQAIPNQKGARLL